MKIFLKRAGLNKNSCFLQHAFPGGFRLSGYQPQAGAGIGLPETVQACICRIHSPGFDFNRYCI